MTRAPGENGKFREVQSGLHWPGLLRGMHCARTFLTYFFLCFVGICAFFPVVAKHRTDGCTTATPNWGTNEPNNGNQVDNSTETVAAILYLDVTIGTMTSFDAGTLYDDKKSNLHPAIYECCESSLSGGCPSEAPSMMPSAGGGGLM